MIKIQDLEFYYQKQSPVFSGLSMNLHGGSIYGLLGKNGAGKSTLLKNIAGLVFPDSGSLEVLGFNPKNRKSEMLQEICYIAEEFYLPPLKIDKFLKINVPFYPKFDVGYFKSLLSEFDIPISQQLLKMSYGQKKKFLIAFGLATNVKLLIMDEPTNGLDIPSKTQFRKVMASALNDERCVIISTHQVRDLEQLIDTLIILDEGKIALKASIDSITEKLCFKKIKEEDPTAVYTESNMYGYNAVFPNFHQEESKLDMELLFNAILNKKSKITPHFN